MPSVGDGADVVVIGGGPAGSAAALFCARAGLRVVVLESAAFPRDRPGETLHPGAETILRELGVWERVEAFDAPRHAGIWVTWGGPERFAPFGADARGPWRGIQAWRADLDALLLDSARRAGVVILQPVTALGVVWSNGAVAGVETSRGRIASRFLIDAGGGRHWLARQLGIDVDAVSPRLIARYGHARGRCRAADQAPRLAADARGWTWLAHVRADTYAWASVRVAGSAAEVLHPRGLEQLECGKQRAADVTWRTARRVAGPGYLLAGDAAFVIDPASSHGVLRAMMTGAQAARVATAALAEPHNATDLLCGYRRYLHEWFTHDVARLSELYSQVFNGWAASVPQAF